MRRLGAGFIVAVGLVIGQASPVWSQSAPEPSPVAKVEDGTAAKTEGQGPVTPAWADQLWLSLAQSVVPRGVTNGDAPFNWAAVSWSSVIIYVLEFLVALVGLAVLVVGRRTVLSLERSLDAGRSERDPRAALERINETLPRWLRKDLQMSLVTDALTRIEDREFLLVSPDKLFPDELFEHATRFRFQKTWQPLAFFKALARPFVGQLNLRSMSVIPGILTGLGLFGTFLGICLGLGQLLQSGGGASRVIDGDTAKQLMGALPNVISGLATAFWTSIFGLLFALPLGFLGHRLDERVARAASGFRSAIESRFPHANPEQLLSRQLLAELAEIRREAVDSRGLLTTISGDLVDKLPSQLHDRLLKDLVPHLEAVTQVISSQVTQAGQVSQESAQKFTSEMVSQLSTGLKGSFEAVGDRVDSLGTRLGEMTESVARVMASVSQTVAEQRDILQKSSDATRAAHERSEAAAGHLVDTLGAAATLSTLLDRLTMVQGQAGALAESQGRLHTASAKTLEDFVSRVQQQGSIYIESADRFGKVLEGLQARLDVLHDSVSGLSQAAQTSATTLTQAADRIDGRVSQEEKLLSGYSEAASSFSRALKESGPTFATLSESSTRISATTQALLQLMVQLKQLNEAVNKSAQSLGEGLAGMRDAADRMKTVSVETDKWVGGTTAAIQRFGQGMSQSVEESLRKYDESLSQAVDGLRGTIQDLEDAAESLLRSVRSGGASAGSGGVATGAQNKPG